MFISHHFLGCFKNKQNIVVFFRKPTKARAKIFHYNAPASKVWTVNIILLLRIQHGYLNIISLLKEVISVMQKGQKITENKCQTKTKDSTTSTINQIPNGPWKYCILNKIYHNKLPFFSFWIIEVSSHALTVTIHILSLSHAHVTPKIPGTVSWRLYTGTEIWYSRNCHWRTVFLEERLHCIGAKIVS